MAEKAAALVKAFFPNPSPKEWPANPEEACIKHSHFLKLWLVEKLNKKTARNAWKTACNGKLTIAKINSILNCIAEIRHFALRKWRNMKTGEKTHPSVLEVMATMRGQQPGKGTPDEKAWTPTKRLKSKAGPILMIAAEKLSGVEEDEVLSVSSNSGTAVSSVLCAEQLVKAGAVMKKPATGNCTPGSLQKAAGPKNFKRPASLQKAVWEQSASLGMVKTTMASQKAYVVTKLENGKESCLVNINVAKGELMDQLVHDSSLSKAKLVDLKNQLLREGA